MKNIKRPYIVCFTGTHGTGKTTTLQDIVELFSGHTNLRVCLIDEVVRSLMKELGIKNNKDARDVDQMVMTIAFVSYWYSSLIGEYDLILSDRSAVCLSAYTNTNENISDAVKGIVEKCLVYLPDILWYFPITREIPLLGDTARSPDPEYQKAVDDEIHRILSVHHIQDKTILRSVLSTSREDRAREVADYICHYFFQQVELPTHIFRTVHIE